MRPVIDVDREQLAGFCRRHAIRTLAVFGSALRGDLRPGSDVDILVEFERGKEPGMIRLAAMADELSGVLGRKADLRTAEDLSRYFRDEVLAAAEVLYEG